MDTFVEGLGLGLSIGLILGIAAALALRVIGAWLGAIASGVSLPMGQLIGMRLRRTPIQLVVDAHVALTKRGHPVDLGQVEAAYLAHRSSIRTEQDLVEAVEAAIPAAE